MAALIRCEDCSKQISDLAPHCIHCGRPKTVTEGRSGQDDAEPQDWEEQLKERGQAILKKTGAAARAVGSKTRDLSALLGGHAKDLPAKLVEKLVEDREVEVMVLPLGSGPSDFLCSLDLDDTLDALASGVLVRPKLNVWAHRDDLDREQLASKLEEEFSRQVKAFRTRKQAGHDKQAQAEITAAKVAKKDAAKTKIGGWKSFWAASAAMLLITNPILDVILLLVAVTGGADAITEALRETGAEVDKERAEVKHDKLTKELQHDVGLKKRSFRTALGRMQISVHPRLIELARDFAELDSATEPGAGEVPTTGPDVLRFLNSDSYRSQVPEWYDPLLDARLESWR